MYEELNARSSGFTRVEIGEKFDVAESPFGNWTFTENGLLVGGGSADGNEWRGIFTGEWAIIKKPWEPEKGSKYYYIDTEGNVDYNWFENAYDHAMLDSGNCFRTEQEARVNREAITEKFGWK